MSSKIRGSSPLAPGGRALLRIAFVALMLPIFAVAGGVVAIPFAYGWKPEDVAAPSSGVTVMAVWESEEGPLCRAFDLSELLSHRDTLRLRFALTDTDVERCQYDFAAYDDSVGWPRTLTEDEPRFPDHWFRVQRSESDLIVVVHRSSGDATWTRTRYKVDEEGAITELELRSASAGQGLGLVLGGFLGALVWMGWVVRMGWGAWRRRGTDPRGDPESPPT